MTGEEIGREQKAKKLARQVIATAIEIIVKDPEAWDALVSRAGFSSGSDKTKRRTVEILEGIAI